MSQPLHRQIWLAQEAKHILGEERAGRFSKTAPADPEQTQRAAASHLAARVHIWPIFDLETGAGKGCKRLKQRILAVKP